MQNIHHRAIRKLQTYKQKPPPCRKDSLKQLLGQWVKKENYKWITKSQNDNMACNNLEERYGQNDNRKEIIKWFYYLKRKYETKCSNNPVQEGRKRARK